METFENSPVFKKSEELNNLYKSQEKLKTKYDALFDQLKEKVKNFNEAEKTEIMAELERINLSIDEIKLLTDTLHDEIDVLADKFSLN